jgi:hypothetical protein
LEGGDEDFVVLADAMDQAARILGWYGGYSHGVFSHDGYSHGNYMNGDGGDGGSYGSDEDEDEVSRPNGGSTSPYMRGGSSRYSEYDNGGDMDEEEEESRPTGGYGSRGGGGSYFYSSGYHGYNGGGRGRSYSYSQNYHTNDVRPAKIMYTEPVVVQEPVVVERNDNNYHHGGKGKG